MHCEKVGASKATSVQSGLSSTDSNGSSNIAVPVIFSALSVGIVAVGVAFALVYRRKKRNALQLRYSVEKAVSATAEKSHAQVNVGPESDIEGNQLDNVEII